MSGSSAPVRVLVTGGAGYVGRTFLDALRQRRPEAFVLAMDVQALPPEFHGEQVMFEERDVRSDGLAELLEAQRIDVVVHLAAVVTPGPDTTAEIQREVDVGGTQKVLDACLAAGVGRVVVTSSGAAYGYHPDHPPLIQEDRPLRAQESFTYAHNKLLVEELMARYRQEHPELEQVILRLGMVIGPQGKNLLTDLFDQPVVLGIRGVATPITFVAEADLAAALVHAVDAQTVGVFNIVGDGVMTLKEIARRLGKPYLALPGGVWRGVLGWTQKRGLLPYGPEQVVWLEHKPVLSTVRLKNEFGFLPRYSTHEAFEQWAQQRPAPSAVLRWFGEMR